MGKKRTRSAKTSKGERRSIVAGVKEVRRDVSAFAKNAHKLDAWRLGKNPWITVPGTASNARFIRVRANTVYGNPKTSSANLFGGKVDAS